MKNIGQAIIVEDDLALAKQHYNVLMDEGYRPMTANNLAEARWYLDKCLPISVIFIDITLSDGCGLDLIPEIRKKNRHTHIIFFAAKNEPETVTAELKTNGIDCIENPRDISDFHRRIAALPSRKQQRAATPPPRVRRTARQVVYA